MNIRRLLWVLLLVLLIALPVAGQGDEGGLLVVTGRVSFDSDGQIIVADFIIAPAAGFNPASLLEGDEVIITGTLLPDGETIQALSIEPFDVSEFEAAGQPEDDVQANNGQGNSSRGQGNQGRGTDDEEETGTQSGSGNNGNRGNQGNNGNNSPGNQGNNSGQAANTNRGNNDNRGNQGNNGNGALNADNDSKGAFCETGEEHPVAARIAEEFASEGATYEAVMTAFCEDGFGFGEIMLAYRLAVDNELPLSSAQSFLAQRAQGQGWGNIFRENRVNPADFAPGRSQNRGRGNN